MFEVRPESLLSLLPLNALGRNLRLNRPIKTAPLLLEFPSYVLNYSLHDSSLMS